MEQKYANPTPLGLISFGLTTALLSFSNAGFFPSEAAILAMAFFLGGIAQTFAGIMEFFRGNTFGCAAFTAFGAFWLSLFGITLFPVLGWAKTENMNLLGAWIGLWGLYAFLLTLAIFKGGRVLSFVFVTLVIVFWALSAFYFTGSTAILTFAGYLGVVCGLSAFYLGVAIVLDETAGKKILPY
ncbi:MAG: acetate uptake transporter [Deltaproteobacteria bacterium]|jgi:succinate-acetate transporter protein|nr:acetate uptake transporter [Deltaproteobacteria bacterium]